VLGLNDSNRATSPEIRYVASEHHGARSAAIHLVTGAGSATCGHNGHVCRWSDGSSANPYLYASTSGVVGGVFLSRTTVRSGIPYATANYYIAP
jgi:hypothetical protein